MGGTGPPHNPGEQARKRQDQQRKKRLQDTLGAKGGSLGQQWHGNGFDRHGKRDKVDLGGEKSRLLQTLDTRDANKKNRQADQTLNKLEQRQGAGDLGTLGKRIADKAQEMVNSNKFSEDPIMSIEQYRSLGSKRWSRHRGENKSRGLAELWREAGRPKLHGENWCGAFVVVALKRGGVSDAKYLKSLFGAKAARAFAGKNPERIQSLDLGKLQADEQARNKRLSKPGVIMPGDVVVFGNRHLGIVKSYDAGTGKLITLEGNTWGRDGIGRAMEKSYYLRSDTLDYKDPKKKGKRVEVSGKNKRIPCFLRYVQGTAGDGRQRTPASTVGRPGDARAARPVDAGPLAARDVRTARPKDARMTRPADAGPFDAARPAGVGTSMQDPRTGMDGGKRTDAGPARLRDAGVARPVDAGPPMPKDAGPATPKDAGITGPGDAGPHDAAHPGGVGTRMPDARTGVDGGKSAEAGPARPSDTGDAITKPQHHSLLERLDRLGNAAEKEGREGGKFKEIVGDFRQALKTGLDAVKPGDPLPPNLHLVIKALGVWSKDPGDQWGEGWWDSQDLVMSAPDYATVPASQSKCNAYVAEVIYQALGIVHRAIPEEIDLVLPGLNPFGLQRQKRKTGKYFPHRAKEWGNPKWSIPHFEMVKKPQIGDIWSNGNHVGIYLGTYRDKQLYISARDTLFSQGVFGAKAGLQHGDGIQIKYIPEKGIFRRYKPQQGGS